MEYKSLKKYYDKNKIKKRPYLFGLLNRFLIASIIVLIALILIKSSSKAQDFVENKVFGSNFSFAYIKNLYESYFGEVIPDINNKTEEVFNEKLTFTNKEKYYDGVKLTVSDNYLMPLIQTGIVVFIGEKENYGNTIIVEGVDNYNIWYGNINTSNVSLYDYLKKGEFLGEIEGDVSYIAIEKDNSFIDFDEYLK